MQSDIASADILAKLLPMLKVGKNTKVLLQADEKGLELIALSPQKDVRVTLVLLKQVFHSYHFDPLRRVPLPVDDPMHPGDAVAPGGVAGQGMAGRAVAGSSLDDEFGLDQDSIHHPDTPPAGGGSSSSSKGFGKKDIGHQEQRYQWINPVRKTK